MPHEVVDEFDILAPRLPTGTTLLEASAGTGKTWTIGALVARYVAEGHARLDELLVVTFGRAASQELRQRVRTQLEAVADGLAAATGEGVAAAEHADDAEAPGPADEVVALLCTGTPAELRARRERVSAALAHFDGATIATIHQFCQQVLRSLGVAGDTDPSARLVEDVDDLRDEVVEDLYVRGFADDPDPAFTVAEAREIGAAVVGDPQALVVPEHPADEAPALRRTRFARAVRAELERRKRRAGLLGYDDLLSQLATALEADDAAARARMRLRWKVVLVDEFQDTDPVQWQVFDRAFAGHATMVLIGDPKQAIYGFRGGDVVTYLDAAATATTHQTLATNWRSDAGLVAAVQRLLEGAALGDERITVRPVRAHHQARRLQGAPHGDPFRLRVVRRTTVDPGARPRGALRVGTVRPHLEADCAHDVAALLASGAEWDGRPVRAGDVAILAHTRWQLESLQEALTAVGVRSVFAGGGSVFASPAAEEWATLLEAMEAPHRSALVRAAALTCFVGETPTTLDTDGDRATERVADLLRGWSALLGRRGVAAVFEAAVRHGLFARVLGRDDGERHLTDLRHLAETLHLASRGEARGGREGARGESLGLAGLVAWLRREMRDDAGEGISERTRRLDSDAAAVQLVTVHGSKGLQYPVVYLPYLADRWVREPTVPRFHLPADGDGVRRRAVDVGGRSGPHWARSLSEHAQEEAGESLRLLYVALTRAQSQVVAWWAPTTNAPGAPLHRVLFGRTAGSSAVADPAALPGDDEALSRLGALQAAGGPVVEESVAAPPRVVLPAVAEPPLAVRSFDREVDVEWRRTSYSSLSAAGAGHGGHGGAAAGAGPDAATATSEPELTPREDEPDLPVRPGDAGGGGAGGRDAVVPGEDPVSPMATLPVGATFGSLVHGVLEHADLTVPDLGAELAGHVAEQRTWWPVAGLDEEVLVGALEAVATTSLGPLAAGRTLREVPPADTLRELDFELPLAGGDLARGRTPGRTPGPRLGDLAPLLRAHLPQADPVRAYAEVLDGDPQLADQALRGYLGGSVDVLLRVRGAAAGGEDAYLVVDYKTNWLGPVPEADEPPALRASAYAPAALDAAMGGSDYPLQALLYAVVAHRFLRWRLRGYDPAVHLGGVLYLYLRGMCGPATPVVDGAPCGVFSWRPPVALVEAVSDLLDGGAS
ncbi:UvrD-helicase domain-containing protein [Nocardioides sp. ChNu-99]|nr:UvrD-helicase domain-containing protein [Nocardioides sp. ChNu-99]